MITILQPEGRNRLSDLLLEPREALDVEIKNWLDLAGNNEHKATLAKALLALANHGGGFVIIGLTETDTGVETATGRPATLEAYSQDVVNGIVHNYAEPPFHCSVQFVPHPTSDVTHPIIGVPGGNRVPIRAKRDGPNSQIVQQHDVYIRRPGPQSETPRTAREWDELFTKCLDGRRDELLDRIRDLLIGIPPSEKNQTETSRLDRWVKGCEDVWRKKSPVSRPTARHAALTDSIYLPTMLTAENDSNYLSCWMFCAMRRVSQAGTRGGFQRNTRLNRTAEMVPSSAGSVVIQASAITMPTTPTSGA